MTSPVFETKDSGQRTEFASGMARDVSTDKILYHLVFDGPMFKRDAELLTRGAKKYGQRNWMKAKGQEELDRAKESAARHFAQWLLGETNEDHAAAIRFNVNLAEYVKERMAAAVPAEPTALPADLSFAVHNELYAMEDGTVVRAIRGGTGGRDPAIDGKRSFNQYHDRHNPCWTTGNFGLSDFMYFVEEK